MSEGFPYGFLRRSLKAEGCEKFHAKPKSTIRPYGIAYRRDGTLSICERTADALA